MKVQNEKFARMQARTNFEIRFLISDVFPKLVLHKKKDLIKIAKSDSNYCEDNMVH